MRDDIEFNIKFCEIIEKFPALYDYTKPEYSNRNVQDKIWREIGFKVNGTAKECKDRWKNIRCSYAKSKKSMNAPSGSAAKPIKEYYLASHLHFLDIFLKSRSSTGNLDNITDQIYDEEESWTSMSAGSSAGEQKGADFITPQSTLPPPKKTQIHLSDVNKTAFEYFSKKNSQVKPKDQNKEDSDSDMAFFRSMLPDVKTMNQDQKRKFKIGVLNLIEQILKEPNICPTSYSRSSLRTESPYQRTPSRESEYDIRPYGSPIQQQTHPALHQTQQILHQTQPRLHQTQQILGQTQPPLHQTKPSLQPTQSSLTQVYLPIFSPVTPHDNSANDFSSYSGSNSGMMISINTLISFQSQ